LHYVWFSNLETVKSHTQNSVQYVYVFLISQAGGAAGLAVDTLLFPLDTVKTRLQSAEGFYKSGAFKGIYRGIAPVLLGSIPSGE
jgi:solute carrier family 25 S-adenosylmethionine transporter 26